MKILGYFSALFLCAIFLGYFSALFFSAFFLIKNKGSSVKLTAIFRALPPGSHGFHIHAAGDLRKSGCSGACDHYHKGSSAVNHGGPPGSDTLQRHTGDLGNVNELGTYTYILDNVRCSDLVGRAIIIHADEDDLGKGGFDDSLTTGHSGARIACGILGRVKCNGKTRKRTDKRT